MTTKRTCVSCKKKLPEEQFSSSQDRLDNARCSTCLGQQRRRNTAKSRISHLGQLLTEIRYRAKKKGLEVAITKEDLEAMWQAQEGRCALSSMPLTHHRRGDITNRSPHNVSIDRVEVNGPYTKDNVQLVCSVVNLMRRTMEIDEFISWCKQISDHNLT